MPSKQVFIHYLHIFNIYFKWEMVCDRRILIATSQSVVLAANPLGTIIGGALTDR